ncbi:hypothetical protein ACM39_15515 [Chryseobacterium sp. FH2]|uniref:hypothetical protein n=1 Tax=Chryseobacterium sp. FH2 TaxID=1674291 RepID=UPI00065AC8AE|nr:hypothetical protein [Chryseobacterium sp. FH2]KMQ67179.1 hypothetical protein ACM39_15515 [Chryseobacterium sp. FH2]
MKKLFFIGALAFSAFTFANKKELKTEVRQEKISVMKELTKEQKNVLALLIQWWSVSYTNACGGTNTVFFQSNNADGSAGFIRELAFAVNSTYGDC